MSDLHTLVADVVAAGNCSGCGACAVLSPSLRMEVVDDLWTRPVVVPARPVPAGAADRFRRVCPGRSVTAPPVEAGTAVHPVFGRHLSVWAAWAVDPEARNRGSSGGVLTALSAYLLECGDAQRAVAVTESRQEPGRTVAVEITTRAEALAAAGSRYAPVGTVAALDPSAPPDIVVGKPCEIDATQRLLPADAASRPLLLSFFCAGVPSQRATTELVAELGVELGPTGSVRYRGQGWPGDFVATGADGRSARMPYEQAWGQRLGRHVQDRCKICPEATGEHADIAVGDFWAVMTGVTRCSPRATARRWPSLAPAAVRICCSRPNRMVCSRCVLSTWPTWPRSSPRRYDGAPNCSAGCGAGAWPAGRCPATAGSP